MSSFVTFGGDVAEAKECHKAPLVEPSAAALQTAGNGTILLQSLRLQKGVHVLRAGWRSIEQEKRLSEDVQCS